MSKFWLCLAMAWAIVVSGCGVKPPGVGAGRSASGGAVARPKLSEPGPPPTAEECEAFAQELLAALHSDSNEHIPLIAVERLAERILRHTGLTGPEGSAAFDGFCLGLRQSDCLWNVRSSIGSGGDFAFLRVVGTEGNHRPIFRLLHSNGGVAYLEFELVREPDGSFRIVDLFDHSAGNFISRGMAPLFLAAMGEKAAAGWQGLFKSGGPETAAAITRMGELFQAGRREEALAVYWTLPRDVQESRMMMQFRVACTQSDMEEYKKSLSELRRLFGRDGTLDLMMIDYAIMEERYDEALKLVDRVDRNVGGDGYLDTLRATTLFRMGRTAEALEKIEAATEACPDLIVCHWTAIEIALELKDFEATLAWLRKIDERFEIEWNDLTAEPIYAEFAQSPQYQQWLEYLNSKPGEP